MAKNFNPRNRRKDKKPAKTTSAAANNSTNANAQPHVKDSVHAHAHHKKDVHSGEQLAFPDPTILQEYEYATEGAADRIIAMAEYEQKSRKTWEEEYLSFYRKTYRSGQLFGFIIVISVIISSVILTREGHSDIATILIITAFSTIAFASVVNTITRRRKPRAKFQKKRR